MLPRTTILAIVVAVLAIVAAILFGVAASRGQTGVLSLSETGKSNNKNNTVIIYVLCFDEQTKSIAEEHFGSLAWARVVKIESTYLFENIVFDSWLLQNYDEWKDARYVGTLSWKAPVKIGMLDIDNLNEVADKYDPDLFTFYNTNDVLVKRANSDHPNFEKLWTLWLSELGYSPALSLNPNIPVFVCNYWAAKPKIMKQYITFFRKAKQALSSNTLLHNDLWSDARYTSGLLSPDKLMKLVNRNYYPYHAFLMERLPCFYFWVTNKKVMPFTKRI